MWEGFGTLRINPIEIPHDKQVEPVQERYRQIPLQYHAKLSALLKEMVKDKVHAAAQTARQLFCGYWPNHTLHSFVVHILLQKLINM